MWQLIEIMLYGVSGLYRICVADEERERQGPRVSRSSDRVTFHFDAPFVGAAPPSGHILGVGGVAWLRLILRRVEGLEITQTYQENWGVYLEAARGAGRFWLGISSDGRQRWLVHVHSRGLVRRWSRAGKAERDALILDLHAALKADPGASAVRWFAEAELHHGEGRAEPFFE